MENIDAEGEWWLPGDPDRRVAGWLTFDADEGGTLRLVGSLRDPTAEVEHRSDGSMVVTETSLGRAGTYPRILGQIDSKAVTLEECFRTSLRRQLLGGGLTSEKIDVGRIFRGVWYEPMEEASGDVVTTRLNHLVYWLRRTWTAETWSMDREGRTEFDEPRIELQAVDVPTISIDRPGGTLELVQRLSVTGDRIAERSLRQDVDVLFRATSVRPWHALVDEISAFQDVLTLAIDRVPSIDSLVLKHPDLDQELPNGEIYRSTIDVFARWTDRSARTEAKTLHREDVLFHFDLVESDGLGRLLTAADRYKAELRRVMATQRAVDMYASDRLLNRCAALESFDRVRTDTSQSRFVTRLRRCIVLAGEPFLALVPDTEAWLEGLRTRRDHVAHHLENDDRETGLLDFVLADSVYFLFVLCFLREADAPPAVFEGFGENRRVGWLARQFVDALPRSG